MDHSRECALGADLNGWRDVHPGTCAPLPVTVLLHRCESMSCLSLVPALLVLPLEEIEAKEGIMAKGEQVIYDELLRCKEQKQNTQGFRTAAPAPTAQHLFCLAVGGRASRACFGTVQSHCQITAEAADFL